MKKLILLCLLFGACDPGHENGVKKVYFEGTDQLNQWIQMKNGKKNGYAKEFYKDGVLKKLQYYVNDTLNDSSITFYKNGRVASIQFYKNKERHGCWKDFNKEGGVIKELNFAHDILEGTSCEYTYRTGRLQYKVTYHDGFKDGLEEKYYSSGKPTSKVYYNKGKICFGLEEWYENGKPVKNGITISITEKNETQLNGTLKYFVKLSDAKEDDYVYQMLEEKDNCPGTLYPLKKEGGSHVIIFNIGKGGFVMEKIKLVAKRTTLMGNTYMQIKEFNATGNNY